MYRIVCESYENYKKDFLPNYINDYRYKVAEPLELITDMDLYEAEKMDNTVRYQKLQDLVFMLKNNIAEYPNFKSFLWSLESREICGVDYKVLSEKEFKELVKIINSFLKLAYWSANKTNK